MKGNSRLIGRSIVGICFMAGLGLAIDACVHEPIIQPEPPVVVNPGTPGSINSTTPDCKYQGVCFESSVLPIFISSCAMAGCHNPVNPAEGLVLNSYSGISRHLNDSYEKIMNGEMPPRNSGITLTQAQKDSVTKWINEGAPNTVNCNCFCDTTQFTYNLIIKPLFQNSCVGCHNATSKGGGYDLSTYAGASGSAFLGRVMGCLNQLPGYSPMPKGSKLSTCQIHQVQKWISAGALNN